MLHGQEYDTTRYGHGHANACKCGANLVCPSLFWSHCIMSGTYPTRGEMNTPQVFEVDQCFLDHNQSNYV